MERSQVRSQSSLEYILIVALTFAIMVPTSFLFYNYSRESGQEIIDAQIEKLGRSIIDTSESIFYSGLGSRTVLEISVPDKVTSALIVDGRELIFNVTSDFGTSEIVFFSPVNLTTSAADCTINICKIPQLSSSGNKNVRIESVTADSVSITVI